MVLLKQLELITIENAWSVRSWDENPTQNVFINCRVSDDSVCKPLAELTLSKPCT